METRDHVARGRRAFTLTELLVVVAIIAMLLGLLAPGIGHARREALSVQCLSNQQQIGKALLSYLNDYRGYIPRGEGSNNEWLWCNLLVPYLSEHSSFRMIDDYSRVPVYRCPVFPRRDQPMTYVANAWTFTSKSDHVGTQVFSAPARLSEFDRPASTIYVTDASERLGPVVKPTDEELDFYDVWRANHLPLYETTPFTTQRVAADRHHGAVNCTYVDGHGGRVADDEMTIDRWRDHW